MTLSMRCSHLWSSRGSLGAAAEGDCVDSDVLDPFRAGILRALNDDLLSSGSMDLAT